MSKILDNFIEELRNKFDSYAEVEGSDGIKLALSLEHCLKNTTEPNINSWKIEARYGEKS